jgi:chlorobactene glucosyltransferase
LFQAAAVARGEWLCFVDADTFLNPDAISSCYAKALETKADLFTTLTQQVLGSFWEKVVMPLVMTALSVGFSPRKVNDPNRRDAIANGQFIMIKRAVYDAIGGHEKVKDQIVEDKAISEQVKWNGYRLIVADGLSVIRTRMYTSLPTMWEGWTKNIYLGLRDHPSMLLLGAFGALLALIAALFLPVWPVLGVIWLTTGGGLMSIAVIIESLIVWAALIYMRVRVARVMNISAWYAWTTPLGAGVFASMMLTSAWKVISGTGVTWKGRLYKPK